MVHVVVRSQKQVLDTMLIIKRGAFHQTVLNNGATIVKRVFLQVLNLYMSTIWFLSKVWTKFN